jgi:peptide chain release factor subunit 1
MSTVNPAQDKSLSHSSTPEKLMERLFKFEPTEFPVLSLYLDARVDEHGRRNFSPFIRKQITERAKSYAAQSPERQSVESDLSRILSYLDDNIDVTAQGIAIFACAACNDFFEAGQFDAPFEQNQLFVYDRPHVYPLAHLVDQYRKYAVVLADTNRAQILVFACGREVDRAELQNVKTKQSQAGGWSQSRYERHLENYHQQHVKEVVEVLNRTVQDEGIESVIIAGDEGTIVPLLRAEMSKELSDKVVDAISLGIDTPEHELLEESLKVFRQYDSLSDIEKVEKLLSEYRRDGLAVAGVPETLAALSNGQVEELLIAASAASITFDEAEVKKVLDAYQTEATIGSGGEPSTTLDNDLVADEIVRRAQQLSSARVTFIEDSSVLEQVGGVGALLRYRITAESAAPIEQPDTTSKSEALIEQRGA